MTVNSLDSLVTGVNLERDKGTNSLAHRIVRTELTKTVGQRMLAARQMNGYTQTEASDLLGYRKRTSTQLSLCEQKRRLPPLVTLVRAAHVYRVSVDYLCGLTDEPDRDPASEVNLHIIRSAEGMIRAQTQGLIDFLQAQMEAEGPAYAIARSVLNEGEELVGALNEFLRLSGDQFQEMKGGARLLRVLKSFEANAIVPSRKLDNRHQLAARESAQRMRERAKTQAANADLFEEG